MESSFLAHTYQVSLKEMFFFNCDFSHEVTLKNLQSIPFRTSSLKIKGRSRKKNLHIAAC